MTEYKVDWLTEIIDDRLTVVGDDPVRIPVGGYTIVKATSLEEAQDIAAELVDVDFFAPLENYSASDPAVVSGQMWRTENPDHKTQNLGSLLPEVEEWNFEVVGIVDVQEAEER